LRRIHGGGNLHFITTSCYQREPLLGSARSRDVFLEIFEQVRKGYGFEVIGFVVMPEHVHILISEPKRRTVPIVVQVLKQRVARRLLLKRRPTSQRELWETTRRRFWQRRYYDFNDIRIEKLQKNSGTCIGIRCRGDWCLRLSFGDGAAIGHLLFVKKEW